MPTKRKIITGVSALASALALLIAVPNSAQAAEGTFGYYYNDNNPKTEDWYIIDNPENGQCYTFEHPSRTVSNGTNALVVFVFSDENCVLPIGIVAANVITPLLLDAKSVKFV
jgi:hypothetical protein